MATQVHRIANLETSLGEDVLLLASMTFTDRMNEPFELSLVAYSERGDLRPADLLGQPVSVRLDLPGGTARHVHAVCTECAQEGFGLRFHEYRLTARPWWWLLSRTADCRIFQRQTVPQIVKEVVDKLGFSDYEMRLTGSYPVWDYCVQYRESDLAFLSRLLEHEGIRYFFEHSSSRHTLVLTDDWTGHHAVSGYDMVPYFPPTSAADTRERDHLSSWSFRESFQPGQYATTDYDFTAPSKSLRASSVKPREYVHGDLEVYDYPAEPGPLEASGTDRIAKLRMEELQSCYRTARGSGNALGLATGGRFRLHGYPREDLNIDYVIVNSVLTYQGDPYATGTASSSPPQVTLEAAELRAPYRPARITSKPVVHGAQTAVVVGSAGDEITTDRYGRVKVQFHWDRLGKRNENSSCWVRVSQPWAGKGWGAVYIPRIGEEVVVSFLEGDPDRPIITGRVYNGTQDVPYELPGSASCSGIKSRSTPGGSNDNFNELRFEDKKGAEEVHLQAERDYTALIKHDRSVEVENDETLKTDRDRSTQIGRNDTVQVGKNSALTAGEKITFTTGAASITMQENGDIEIKGRSITIDGSLKVAVSGGQQIEASSVQIKAKGTQVQVQGTMLDLKASGVATLQGSLTKIN